MRRKNAIHEIFMKNTFQKKEFSSSSTSYGKANEIIAKQMYIRNTGNHLHEVGLIVNPGFPFLGATPDGIMSDKSTTAIIEMKCSYTVRDMCICEACELRNYFFLKKNDDLFSLKQSCTLVSNPGSTSYMVALVRKLSEFYIHHFKCKIMMLTE